jgi:hypothetical protein
MFGDHDMICNTLVQKKKKKRIKKKEEEREDFLRLTPTHVTPIPTTHSLSKIPLPLSF